MNILNPLLGEYANGKLKQLWICTELTKEAVISAPTFQVSQDSVNWVIDVHLFTCHYILFQRGFEILCFESKALICYLFVASAPFMSME